MDIKNVMTYKVGVPILNESGYPEQDFIELKIIPFENKFISVCASTHSMIRWESILDLRRKKPYRLFLITREDDGTDNDPLSLINIYYPKSILVNNEQLDFVICFLDDLPVRKTYDNKINAGMSIMEIISKALDSYDNKIDEKWVDNYING